MHFRSYQNFALWTIFPGKVLSFPKKGAGSYFHLQVCHARKIILLLCNFSRIPLTFSLSSYSLLPLRETGIPNLALSGSPRRINAYEMEKMHRALNPDFQRLPRENQEQPVLVIWVFHEGLPKSSYLPHWTKRTYQGRFWSLTRKIAQPCGNFERPFGSGRDQ